MNLKSTVLMSTKTFEGPMLPEAPSTRRKMHCNWNIAQADQNTNRSRPMSETLTRLAQLITCMDYKPKSQKSSVCKDSSQEEPTLQELHSCQHCGQSFPQEAELFSHQCAGCHQQTLSLASCLNGNAACSLCPKTFSTASGLACHMRFFHKKVKTVHLIKKEATLGRKTKRRKSPIFKCRSCDQTFSNSSLLQKHRREEHRREIVVRHPLKFPGKTGKRKYGIYACLYCGKEFMHHLSRLAHFRRHHSDKSELRTTSTKANATVLKSKDVKEDRVPKKRGRPRIRDLPAVVEQNNQEEEEKDEELEEDENDEFPCDSCEKVFQSKAALYNHKKVHEDLPEEDEQDETFSRCSVCSGGIPLSLIPEDCNKKVFHCEPCAEAFTDLEDFLEHCKEHLWQDSEEEMNKC
ncbi:hypothetical protein DNTS_004994 [Danionella cerebrum]|uniref:C2H2-type domain-containing protein n=1 Tax=Danionella cerebrum TaxID=2873325 RepID=A0A553Q9N6_9TELE|nr:hypothetical protein DNTS_004994 [Danionella translucida]